MAFRSVGDGSSERRRALCSASQPPATRAPDLAKLKTAKASVAATHGTAACSKMYAFVAEVKAQSGVKLTMAQANQFIGLAQQIETALGCR